MIAKSIQLLIVLIPIMLLGWLANQWFVPSGEFFVSRVVDENSAFLGALSPSQRVVDVPSNTVGFSQQVLEDPVHFFVHPHKDFSQIALTFLFANNGPVVEIAGLTSIEPERYAFKPLHNRLIDESGWDRIDSDGFVLLQRNGGYDSIESFLAEPPSQSRIATYRTSIDHVFRIDGYEPSDVARTLDVSLRGHHEFKTYIKDEVLDVHFAYMDMNRDEGEDTIRVTVFNESGQPVAEARAHDDGNVENNAVPTGLEELTLSVSGLPEGVYKVVMDAPRDIFFRKLTTPQQKLVFLNTVYVGDEVGYREPAEGATFFTNAPSVRMQTRHAEGVQMASLNGEELEIAEPYEWYESDLGVGSVVELRGGDVEVVLSGKIAFASSMYFDPDPVSLNADVDLDGLGIDYVIGAYQSPEPAGFWRSATVVFDRDELVVQEDGSWKFTISAPDVQAEENELWIHRIDAKMSL